MMNNKVFMSYTLKDKDFAVNLQHLMRLRGIEVSSDLSILPGQEIGPALKDMIAASSAMIAILPETGTSGANNVFFEIGAAKALNKIVLGLVPDRDALERIQVPSNLLDLLMIDTNHNSPEHVADTLEQALKAA